MSETPMNQQRRDGLIQDERDPLSYRPKSYQIGGETSSPGNRQAILVNSQKRPSFSENEHVRRCVSSTPASTKSGAAPNGVCGRWSDAMQPPATSCSYVPSGGSPIPGTFCLAIRHGTG